MTIVGFPRAEAFWRRRANSRGPLLRWYTLTSQAHWKNFVDLRITFPSADLVGSCVVFNIGGNKYRLIGKIDYELQTVRVRLVLTHQEYNRNSWKADC